MGVGGGWWCFVGVGGVVGVIEGGCCGGLLWFGDFVVVSQIYSVYLIWVFFAINLVLVFATVGFVVAWVVVTWAVLLFLEGFVMSLSQKIVDYCRENPGKTAMQVANVLGTNGAYVRQAIASAQKRGVVVDLLKIHNRRPGLPKPKLSKQERTALKNLKQYIGSRAGSKKRSDAEHGLAAKSLNQLRVSVVEGVPQPGRIPAGVVSKVRDLYGLCGRDWDVVMSSVLVCKDIQSVFVG